MSREFFVTVTVTYTGRIRATSKDAAAEIALGLNGAHPLDIVDVNIEAVDPRSKEGRLLAVPGAFD